jgi:hypothetical protein
MRTDQRLSLLLEHCTLPLVTADRSPCPRTTSLAVVPGVDSKIRKPGDFWSLFHWLTCDHRMPAISIWSGGEGEIRTPDQGLMSTLVTWTGDSPICTRPPVRTANLVGQSPGHSPLVTRTWWTFTARIPSESSSARQPEHQHPRRALRGVPVSGGAADLGATAVRGRNRKCG